MRRLGPLLMTVLLCCVVWPAAAHVANPAGLQMKELEPGTFEVRFQLPVVSGKVLKAQPVFPPGCRVLSEPEVRDTGGSVLQIWTMACDPRALVGERIGVVGLLGTQSDLVLTLELLNGRRYSAVLRPSRPYFVVPPPPSLLQLGGQALAAGIRRIARRAEILTLILAVVFLGLGWRVLAWSLTAFVAAHALGQFLGARNWMTVSAFLPAMLASLTAFTAAAELMRGRALIRPGWLRPLWPAALFLGVLYGAAQPATLPPEGMSRFEQGAGFILFALGTGAGLLIAGLCAAELRALLHCLPRRSQVGDRVAYRVGYLAGVLSVGLLLYHASARLLLGAVAPAIPFETILFTVLLGLWCRTWAPVHRGSVTALFFSVMVGGLLLGLRGIALPAGTLVVFGSLFLLGAALALQRPPAVAVATPIAVAATVYQGQHAGRMMLEELSLPFANAAGTVAFLSFLLYLSLSLTGRSDEVSLPVPLRALGTLAVLLAVAFRLGEYRAWAGSQLAAETALGFARLPLLAAAAVLAALLLWPRRSRIQLDPGRRRRAPLAHWGMLALAFFVIPHGTVRARNPFFEVRAPSAAQAQRILSLILSDTYNAFNLKDEEEVYDRLEQNLAEDLVADVYLDSRRRLTAGTRQGAEVTVKDVSVVSTGDAIEGTGSTDTFSYPCKWIVTARVRHWQHIHDRQNIYHGILTIRIDDDRWKVAGLELQSEERVILSWQSSS